jgi:hypothetical protein
MDNVQTHNSCNVLVDLCNSFIGFNDIRFSANFYIKHGENKVTQLVCKNQNACLKTPPPLTLLLTCIHLNHVKDILDSDITITHQETFRKFHYIRVQKKQCYCGRASNAEQCQLTKFKFSV